MSQSNRHFYRCYACCHVVAVEGKLEYADRRDGGKEIAVRCLCDGKLELLGRVARKSGLVRDEERCACDGRCTNAPGPSCDCRCGGENHGTGRVVPIEVDAGGVPRVRVENEQECRARAAEYAAAVQPLRDRLQAMRKAREGACYPWNRATPAERSLSDALAAISALRTHKGRLTAIARSVAHHLK